MAQKRKAQLLGQANVEIKTIRKNNTLNGLN